MIHSFACRHRPPPSPPLSCRFPHERNTEMDIWNGLMNIIYITHVDNNHVWLLCEFNIIILHRQPISIYYTLISLNMLSILSENRGYERRDKHLATNSFKKTFLYI